MKIISADFIIGAVSAEQYPRNGLPEFAFAGRSNVGKSSLIKSLLNRKKLVRISSTPGKTREINFFKINGKLLFADLPGFGYAKVPKAAQRQWKKMIERYLVNRNPLVAVVFIVDIRRNPTTLDLDLKNWFDALEIPYIMVATKTDKLSQAERTRQAKKIREAFLGNTAGNTALDLILYSSKSNRGRKELWDVLLELAEGQREENKEEAI